MGLVQGQPPETIGAGKSSIHAQHAHAHRQRQSLIQVRLCSALAVLLRVTTVGQAYEDYCRREDAVGQEQERVRVASLCCLCCLASCSAVQRRFILPAPVSASPRGQPSNCPS